jgi:hypothetical protein
LSASRHKLRQISGKWMTQQRFASQLSFSNERLELCENEDELFPSEVIRRFENRDILMYHQSKESPVFFCLLFFSIFWESFSSVCWIVHFWILKSHQFTFDEVHSLIPWYNTDGFMSEHRKSTN